MNMTTVRHSRANETSQHVMTHYVRHISCLMTKLTKNDSSHANNLLSKIMEIQQIQQKIYTKTSLNVGNNLFLCHIAFESEVTRTYR